MSRPPTVESPTIRYRLVGMIWRPIDPRPVDPEPIGRPLADINHGTDGGYHTHRKRGEEACADCRIAHRDASRAQAARRRDVAA